MVLLKTWEHRPFDIVIISKNEEVQDGNIVQWFVEIDD